MALDITTQLVQAYGTLEKYLDETEYEYMGENHTVIQLCELVRELVEELKALEVHDYWPGAFGGVTK